MPKSAKAKGGSLADPIRLKPFDKQSDLLNVVIETPKGSRNKYAFDEAQRIFRLKKVLPAGMVFPFDFGFVPRTHGEDGDPLDVLVLMEEPAFPGCLIECRLIGVLEGEQRDKAGQARRNDRLLAVEQGNHFYADLREVGDVPPELLREIGEFFVNYHRLDGRHFRVLGTRGAAEARRLIGAQKLAA